MESRVFAHACWMVLEEIVSKRKDSRSIHRCIRMGARIDAFPQRLSFRTSPSLPHSGSGKTGRPVARFGSVSGRLAPFIATLEVRVHLSVSESSHQGTPLPRLRPLGSFTGRLFPVCFLGQTVISLRRVKNHLSGLSVDNSFGFASRYVGKFAPMLSLANKRLWPDAGHA
jgi:hypothetical protein